MSVLPAAGEAFVDVRDQGRSLRAAWHPSGEFFVLSMWRDGACVATARLDRSTTGELVATLARYLAVG